MAMEPTPRDDDWVVETTDRIERFVGTIRDRTAVPATKVARGIVYGIIAGVMGVVALLLLLIAIIRILASYLPGNAWAADLFLGVVFTVLGLLIWRRRTPPSDQR